MSIITLKELEGHRQKLSDDFDDLKKNITKIKKIIRFKKVNYDKYLTTYAGFNSFKSGEKQIISYIKKNYF